LEKSADARVQQEVVEPARREFGEVVQITPKFEALKADPTKVFGAGLGAPASTLHGTGPVMVTCSDWWMVRPRIRRVRST
jgi:hypothetical protein